MLKPYLRYDLCLFIITNAAITPGIQPANVSKNTINTDPHPWSMTASGGNKMASITRNIDIYI